MLCFFIVHPDMPTQRNYSCVICLKTHLKEKDRRAVSNSNLRSHLETILNRRVYDGDRICSKCRTRVRREIKANSVEDMIFANDSFENEDSGTKTAESDISPKTIQLQIASTAKSHRRCIVCKKQNTSRHHLTVVSNEAKTQAFIDKGYFIATNSRCCSNHLIGKYFKQDALNVLKETSQTTFLNRTDINDLLTRTRSMLKDVGKLNFDVQLALSDDDFVILNMFD